MNGADDSRDELPVPVDNVSYVIPTVGIGMLGFLGAAIVSMVVGMALPLPAGLMMALDAAAGVAAAAWWVRRRWRIHRERKLVVDRDGITYYRFADSTRLMKWDDIVRVVEYVDRGDETIRWMDLSLKSGSFRLENDAFVGYDRVRERIRKRLGSRAELQNA
jgi:hypothetical protein